MLHHIALVFKFAHENLHKNVNENKYNFAIFGGIFMKYSPKCRTEKGSLTVWALYDYFSDSQNTAF